jgi:hypothetical protein
MTQRTERSGSKRPPTRGTFRPPFRRPHKTSIYTIHRAKLPSLRFLCRCPWCRDLPSQALWHSGTLALWHLGTLAPWHSGSDTWHLRPQSPWKQIAVWIARYSALGTQGSGLGARGLGLRAGGWSREPVSEGSRERTTGGAPHRFGRRQRQPRRAQIRRRQRDRDERWPGARPTFAGRETGSEFRTGSHAPP